MVMEIIGNSMETNEITESNQLIAEFMLPAIYQPSCAGTGDSCFSFEVYYSEENAKQDYPDSAILKYSYDDIEEPTFVDDLLYDKSWDWLMPVVRKIVEYCCNEDEDAFLSDEYTSILTVIPLATIEDAFRVVVEFIKWYNENKKS
jgi:hypothetical protein